MTDHFYIRSGGKVLGPFSDEQLDSLRTRGRIKLDHEISSDRREWLQAADFFRKAESRKAVGMTKSSREEWFYSDEGRRAGPFSLRELKDLLKRGELLKDDLVWKEGFEDWTPVFAIPELQGIVQTPMQGRLVDAPSPNLLRVCQRCRTQNPIGGEFCPHCGAHYQGFPGGSMALDARKDRVVAALLAFFLGGIGVHHFYLGNTALGVLYLLFFWTFIPSLIALIEGIVLLCTSTAAFDAQYNSPR